MKVEVFVGDSGSIGVVKSGEAHQLPQDQGLWGKQKDLVIEEDDELRAGLDVQTCIEDIERSGYHIARTKIKPNGHAE